MARRSPVGLCEDCRHVRMVPGRQSTFVLCTRALTDPAYAKYPVLPVVICPGYEPPPTAPSDDPA